MSEAIVVGTLAAASLLLWAAVLAWVLVRVWPRGGAGRGLALVQAGIAGLLALLVLRSPAILGLLFYALFPWHLVWDPDEAFYRQHFEQVSGQGFPASGSFVVTHSTTPHAAFGDYMACGAFTVSAEDYARLARALDGQRVPLRRWIGNDCLDRVEAALPPEPRLRLSRDDRPENDLSLAWGLLEDGKTVIFQKLQW